jgi:hypothetical protein
MTLMIFRRVALFSLLIAGLSCGLAREISPSPVEMAGLDIPLKGPEGILNLSRNQPGTIRLTGIPEGKYRLAVQIRFADKSGREGTSMLGRYNFVLPKSSYTFTVGGNPVEMTISPRDPKLLGPDSKVDPVFTGWQYSDSFLTLHPADTLIVTCRKSKAFIQKVVLLDVTAWEVEQLRASDQLTYPPGFGEAWSGMTWTPKQVYAVKTLDRICRALEAFEKSTFVKAVGGSVSFSSLVGQGRSLQRDIETYKKHPAANDRTFINHGKRLVDRWNVFFNQVDTEIKKTVPPIEALITPSLKESKGRAIRECAAGREARFNAQVAEKYLTGAAEECKQLGGAEDVYKDHEILALTCVQNAAEFSLKAKAEAQKPQRPVVFKEFEVAPSPAVVSPAAPTAQEKICLNGQWGFSVADDPDSLPKDWATRQVPDEAPAFSYNWECISDEKWANSTRAYWKSGAIKTAWFRTDFDVPARWNGSTIVIRFEEVMLYGEIFINGRFVENHYGGLIPYEIDVTKYAVPGKTNHLLVFVSSNEKTAHRGSKSGKNCSMSNLYPVTDQHVHHMGIRGNVELIARPKVFIEDVYIRTSVEKMTIVVETTLRNDGRETKTIRLSQTVRKDGKDVLSLDPRNVTLKPGEKKVVTVSRPWKDPKLWGIGGEYGSPDNRYFLAGSIDDGKPLDQKFTEFGFRELSIRGNKFCLNGKEIPIQGDSDSMCERERDRHNRWDFAQANRMRREANINMLRLHRFQFTKVFFEVANWTGLLMEGEGPWWTLFSPDNLIKEPCYDDPVWLANCEEYYRTIVKTHRNEPSFVFWSVENEGLSSGNVKTMLKFNEWSRQAAPHLVLSEHAHATAWDDRFPVCDFHDYDLYPARMKEWAEVAGPNHKPMIMGEYWNPDVATAMSSSDPLQARGAEGVMAKWLKRTIHDYVAAGAAGVMPYTFRSNSALFCSARAKTMGPWADLIKGKGSAIVYVPWPSLSGTGGWRNEKICQVWYMGNINYFDPARPVCTPTKAFYAYKEAFRPMPLGPIVRPPELIVGVRSQGKPVSGVNVFVSPKSGESLSLTGVRADADGKAWFILSEPGTYNISLEVNGKTIQKEVQLATSILNDQAGFDYIAQVQIDAATGEMKKVLPKPVKKISLAGSGPEKKIEKASADLTHTPAMSEEGFIRHWIVYGPFPNHGDRHRPDKGAWNVDLLKKYGGEAAAIPGGGLKETVEFKEDPAAYWEPGKIEIAWTPFASPTDEVNLSLAFGRSDLPGLEGSLQYIMGYAACWVESNRDQKAVITLGSDDGYKLWINHKLVAQHRVFRGCTKDEDRHNVELTKGWNLILLKVEQDIGGYEFALRFLTPEGRPIKMPVRTSPPAAPAAGQPVTMGEWVKTFLICGPFPNGGGRPNCKGFDQDFFTAEGGEADLQPVEGKTYSVKFPADDQAYWNEGEIKVAWKKYTAPDADVNMSKPLLLPGTEGLNIEPLQYIVGYAAAALTSDQSSKANLEVQTYNGLKVWLNGRLVLSEHKHTFNRDPASQVLPKSAEATYTVPVELTAGTNRLLVKTDVDYGPMTFKLRFTK